MARWVCPADQIEYRYICKATDFNLFTTMFGTILFNPANVGSGIQGVPAPPCDRGYLIAWVVDKDNQPIKFDGLIGNAIIRDANELSSAYNAIPIKAAPDLNTLDVTSRDGKLHFDGITRGSYQQVTGVIQGSVRFDAGTTPGPAVTTDLTLLTLDVLSNQPNNIVFEELDFYNANGVRVSTFTEFICWTELTLSDVNGATNFINSVLTAADMGSQDGSVVSGPAVPQTGPVSLLGFVTTSVRPNNGTAPYAYSYWLYNEGLKNN
jgi:hypothetical protein